MRGAAELTVKKAPVRLVWTTFSKMASSVEPVGVLPEMPALAKTDAAVASGNESLFACELHDDSSWMNG
jgi:hypothetical protein